ncbi:hypothetical protein TVAG_250030 [Trichomonas vaginalis G3]|uniref:Uncharacterized protein n=1 Tax=Trichomonas vaginalis (strain ATCC PRA-98 / G3) TaxID=412133 RepID=A2DCK6_TRIV3|nr:hypothetical protein TVAGG3_0956300 [Trichomonas vaginalis G3]EAY21943.1 hypothetical protein TVAG_250030 [Trichomonas vaginalis G3]KAI5487581.1 hypothetical protein TVAGG3_0956300 [Trichomonas vaginalis G3]|eukprot:XP_001582929.1 hypothetical protein [Trichomonas vaginalis G3]
MLEERLEYLDLFHFVTKLAGEDTSFINMFRDSLSRVLKAKVQRIIQNLSPKVQIKSDQEFVRRPEYTELLQETKTQFYGIINSIKQNHLWFGQGGGINVGDPAEALKQFATKTSYTVQDMVILRSIPIERICFLPELCLYHRALFHACLSDDDFVRSYAFSQILEAPQLMDAKQYFDVMSEVITLWGAEKITIELAGGLHFLLVSLGEVISDILDDEIQLKLYSLIECAITSPNFSYLFIFDPLLKWLSKSFPKENIKRIEDASLELLKNGSHAHACLIFSSISRGFTKYGHLLETVIATKSCIANWPHTVQVETRRHLASLATRIPKDIMKDLLLQISEMLSIPNTIYVYSEFITSYFTNSNADFCEPLFKTLLNIMAANKTQEIIRMFVALCAHPVRFLNAMTISQDMEIFKCFTDFQKIDFSFYSILFKDSHLLLPKNNSDNIISGISSIVENEVDNASQLNNIMITCMLYPSKLLNTLKNFDSLINEEQKVFVTSLVAAIAAAGNFPQISEYIQLIPVHKFTCDYSEIQNLAKKYSESNIFTGLSASFGSQINIDNNLIVMSLFFEHIVYSEGSQVLTAFKRAYVKPALWFAAEFVSLFSPLLSEPKDFAQRLSEVKENKVAIVCIAYYLAQKLSPLLFDCIDKEDYFSVPQTAFFPKKFIVDTDEVEFTKKLSEKYSNIYETINEIVSIRLK